MGERWGRMCELLPLCYTVHFIAETTWGGVTEEEVEVEVEVEVEAEVEAEVEVQRGGGSNLQVLQKKMIGIHLRSGHMSHGARDGNAMAKAPPSLQARRARKRRRQCCRADVRREGAGGLKGGALG